MDSGQVPVEYHDVVASAGGVLQSSFAVMDHVHGEPGVAQALPDPGGQRDVIFHNQHPHLHILRRPG